MKRAFWLMAIVVVCLGAGCTASTEIRQQAFDLDQRIQTFRTAEMARIEKLNQDYRDAYDVLVRRLEDAGDHQLAFDRDRDAQGAADMMMVDVEEATLPGRFTDRLRATVQRQRGVLLAMDKEIQAARDQYAKSYKELKLAVNKLDELRSKLKVLYAEDNTQDTISLVLNSVRAAYDGIKEAEKSSEPAK